RRHTRFSRDWSSDVCSSDLSYTATDASGIVENEICPVFTARIAGPLDPWPDEVAEWEWISPDALLTAIEAAPFAFSPWLRKQLRSEERRVGKESRLWWSTPA